VVIAQGDYESTRGENERGSMDGLSLPHILVRYYLFPMLYYTLSHIPLTIYLRKKPMILLGMHVCLMQGKNI
jgi:hypothetical protein